MNHCQAVVELAEEHVHEARMHRIVDDIVQDVLQPLLLDVSTDAFDELFFDTTLEAVRSHEREFRFRTDSRLSQIISDVVVAEGTNIIHEVMTELGSAIRTEQTEVCKSRAVALIHDSRCSTAEHRKARHTPHAGCAVTRALAGPSRIQHGGSGV